MAKKSTKTMSAKARREQQTQAKKQQNIRYLAVGLFGLMVVAVVAFFARNSGRASVDFGELAGVQIDGSPDAPIQIVEFGDFGCHACRQWHNADVKLLLQAQFGDDVAFSFRHFPVITPNSPKAAQAGQCAAEQDAFWAYHDYIYESTPEGALADRDLKQYAGDIGLDTGAFNECLDSDRYFDYIRNDMQEARRAGARGTPTFLINGQAVSSQPNAMIAMIESLLE